MAEIVKDNNWSRTLKLQIRNSKIIYLICRCAILWVVKKVLFVNEKIISIFVKVASTWNKTLQLVLRVHVKVEILLKREMENFQTFLRCENLWISMSADGKSSL